jgi:hypothetical protein
VVVRDYNFTRKALFYSPNFGEGIERSNLIVIRRLLRAKCKSALATTYSH